MSNINQRNQGYPNKNILQFYKTIKGKPQTSYYPKEQDHQNLKSSDYKKPISQQSNYLQTQKKMKFQNSLIPKQPQQPKFNDEKLNYQSPYDYQWANSILKGYYKVEVKKNYRGFLILQKVKEDGLEQSSDYFENFDSNKVSKIEQICNKPTINKDSQVHLQKQESKHKKEFQINTYHPKSQKCHKKNKSNLVQNTSMSQYQEQMPIFDINFHKNVIFKNLIGPQQNQVNLLLET